MDASRFDFLTRSLAAHSRRHVSRALAGLGFAGMLGAASALPAVAGKRRKRKCKGNTKKCGKRCIPRANCCSDKGCDSSLGLICVDGQCVCGVRRGASIQAC
jgi:hypothetical protein